MRLTVDVAKCVGCFNCLMACKDEHVGNSWLPVTDEQQKHNQKWINPERHERGVHPFTEICFVTKMCFHCTEPSCAKKFPDAVIQRPDDIVLLKPEKAKGNRDLVEACPFGMISWNEERGIAQKCTMCAHLMDNGWQEPRCVQACPLRALSIDKQAKAEGACAVTYSNLHMRDTVFIAGAFEYDDNGVKRAATNAKVQLKQDGNTVEVSCDFFGEFKLDRIPKNSGTYELVCTSDDFAETTKSINVGEESICLDAVTLERV